MFLLPREYSKILIEDPELRKYAETVGDFGRSLICTSVLGEQEQQSLDSGMQPSSGYRGSSTMFSTDSSGCAVGYSVSNRPPLPKGILRNPVLQNIKSRKNLMNSKRRVFLFLKTLCFFARCTNSFFFFHFRRYSMFEMSREEAKVTSEKRRSLPTQFNNSIPKVNFV